MSNIQDAIEQEISEQIDSRIDDAIYENTDVQQLKSDIEDLEAKVSDHEERFKEIISDTIQEDLVNQVMYKITDTLVDSLYGNQEYQLVKKSYLVNLKTELDMIKKQQEEGGQQ
jgi:hypothetical protein|tara:strand:+ start:109 stop:450 length:342 start_codon:yes stop_codon:yes gene_type:complete